MQMRPLHECMIISELEAPGGGGTGGGAPAWHGAAMGVVGGGRSRATGELTKTGRRTPPLPPYRTYMAT